MAKPRKHARNPKSWSSPLCGRQLSRPARSTANVESMKLEEDLDQVNCRHCLRQAGILAPISNARFSEDSEAEREVDEEIYQKEYNEEMEEMEDSQ